MATPYHRFQPLTIAAHRPYDRIMLEQICFPIREQLEQVDEIIENSVVSSVSLATEVARYTTRNGGKRIRPAVFLLAAKLAGASGRRLPSIAAAMEMVHTASLLHDDVVDDAMIRRGKQSARAKWGNRISLVVGDFLWCCATSLILESAPPRFFPIVARAIRATAEGELLEITRQNDPNLDRQTYLKIIEGKTAALFAACGQGGAVMAEVSEQFESALRIYAHHIGMAFQLTDDILDYTCGETAMGKAPGADLKEGNLTLPLIAALEGAAPEEAHIIRNALISQSIKEDTLAEIGIIIKRRGGIETTRQLAGQHVERAKAHIAVFKPSIEHDALNALADYVVERRG